jgi:L-ascorbate metabolism protein UlaG (beta-lactamase superfamily)
MPTTSLGTSLNTSGNKVTWLGHSTFLLTTAAGSTLLIDPWLAGNPACPAPFHKLPRVDVIGITHGHGDHIGDLLTTAGEHKPEIVGIYEMCLWLESKGVKKLHPMSKGGTQKVGDFELTLVDARHSNSIMDDGKVIYGGEAGGYVLRLPGGLTVYHAGDTSLFGDMKLIGEIYKPDLALLPIGDLFTMGPREAAQAIRFLGVKHVIPMHYNTFPALTGTPQALRESAKDIAGLEIHELKPGQTLG